MGTNIIDLEKDYIFQGSCIIILNQTHCGLTLSCAKCFLIIIPFLSKEKNCSTHSSLKHHNSKGNSAITRSEHPNLIQSFVISYQGSKLWCSFPSKNIGQNCLFNSCLSSSLRPFACLRKDQHKIVPVSVKGHLWPHTKPKQLEHIQI